MQEEDKVLLTQFGDRIKKIRQAKFNSLNNFAMDYSILSSATVSRIENAKSDFKFSTFIKLANAMNLPLIVLLLLLQLLVVLKMQQLILSLRLW